MKRYTLRILSAILAVIMLALLLPGCAKKASPVGRYTIGSVNGKAATEYFDEQAKESGTTLEEMAALFQLIGFKGDWSEFIVIEILDGGECSLTVLGEEPESGTWTLAGDKLTIKDKDGETQEFTFSGNTLSGKIKDVDYVFERAAQDRK